MNHAEFLARANGGISAVVGPGLSLAPGFNLKLLATLTDKFSLPKTEVPPDFWGMLSTVVDSNELSTAKVRVVLKEFLRKHQLGSQLQNFCQSRLRSVISLTPDPHLGNALIDRLNRTPSNRELMRISTGGVSIKSGFVPFFQLMGDSEFIGTESQVPLSKAEQMSRRRSWRLILSDFRDVSKACPIVCVGIEEVFELFLECMNEIGNSNARFYQNLIIIGDSSLSENPTLISLLGGNPSVFDPTILEELAQLNAPVYPATKLDPTNRDVTLRFFLQSKELELSEISIVPQTSEIRTNTSRKHQALDQLFRPESRDWLPFALNLDFPRDQVSEVKSLIATAAEQTQPGRASLIVLTGEAGVGKTTLMKRVALDLSDENVLVAWLNSPMGDPALKRLRSLLVQFADANSDLSTLVLVVDVGSTGKRIASAISAAFSGTAVKIVTVCLLRKSEMFLDLFDPNSDYEEITISETMSHQELQALQAYLPLIEIAVDETEAKKMVEEVSTKNARDILCLLWFLIPETRQTISDSLTDEYLGLGRSTGIIGSIAEATNRSGNIARRAYEFAAVGSSIGVPIPLEVMVNALGIDYVEWTNIAGESSPLWGLIYATKWSSVDTVLFQTRNEVVTNQLIRLINGSSLGNTGELKLLRKMIDVCDSTVPIYREFLAEFLVRKKHELRRYDYEEILSLYDLAIDTLPSTDRAFAHHRALCIRDIGGKPSEAYDALLQARELDPSVITEADESIENIETSAAAAVVDAIAKNEVSPDIGAERVKRHLEKAISINPYNLHTYHVSANHLLKVADRIREFDTEESLICVSEAARTVRRALSLVGSEIKTGSKKDTSIEMLESLRARICETSLENFDVKEMISQLLEAKNFASPMMEAALRIMLLRAQETGKGKDFNEVYSMILRMNAYVDDPLTELPIGINAIRVEVLTDWKLRTSPTDEDWNDVFAHCGVLAETGSHAFNPMWRFWQAVACFHLGDLQGANAIFHQLRAKPIPGPIKWAVRFYYLNQKGSELSFTGELRGDQGFGSNKFIVLPDLGTDILCKRGQFGGRSGSTAVVKLGFTFAGPLAIRL